jgi:hypothetical protein
MPRTAHSSVAFMTQLYFVAPAHFAARPSRALRLT